MKIYSQRNGVTGKQAEGRGEEREGRIGNDRRGMSERARWGNKQRNRADEWKTWMRRTTENRLS